MKKENYYKRSHKELVKIHWKLMSEYVRRRDNGICFTCGAKKEWKKMDAGHCIHAGNTLNFWLDSDFRNIHSQCTSCNQYKSGDIANYSIKLEEIHGFGILQELQSLKWKSEKPTPEQIIERIFELKELIKKLPTS